MFVLPPPIHLWKPDPSVMVFGEGTFGSDWVRRAQPLLKEILRAPLPLLPSEVTEGR